MCCWKLTVVFAMYSSRSTSSDGMLAELAPRQGGSYTDNMLGLGHVGRLQKVNNRDQACPLQHSCPAHLLKRSQRCRDGARDQGGTKRGSGLNQAALSSFGGKDAE